MQTLSHRKGGGRWWGQLCTEMPEGSISLTVGHRGLSSMPTSPFLQIPAMTDGVNATDSSLDFHFLKVLPHLDPCLNGDICSYLVDAGNQE